MHRRQLGIPWEPHRFERWTALAKSHFYRTPTELARLVLEEFMSCYLDEQELHRLGMGEFAVKPPGLLVLAIRDANQARGLSIELARQDAAAGMIQQEGKERRVKKAR